VNTRPWTAPRIRACKGREKIVAMTATDFACARILDEAGIHLLLVGDSLGMTVLGYASTLPVTMDEMVHHTAAVARARKHALLVADMPFMSYQPGIDLTMLNAGRLIKEGGADAVKIEGGAERVETVEALCVNGIPVMGHLGLLPQSVNAYGGYPYQGRSEDAVTRMISDAQALERAGAFAIVLEAMPPSAAARVTAAIGIPTIGIGAGPQCDGQILVMHDAVGLGGSKVPRFVKVYADLGAQLRMAVEAYAEEVRSGVFPAAEHEYPESGA